VGKHLKTRSTVVGSASVSAPLETVNDFDPRTPEMSKQPICGDCYFKHHGLCALALERPCPTFRPAGRTLAPPRQPTLVARAPLAAAVAAPATAYAA
jgi:hypothetical protein